MGNELTQTKRRFVAWLIDYPTKAARKAAGVPDSIIAWAEANDVDRVTCQRWKADPDVQRQVADGIRDTWVSNDDVAEILDVLKIQAKQGHVPSARVVLDAAGVMNKQKETSAPEKVNFEELKRLSDAQIEALAAQQAEEDSE